MLIHSTQLHCLKRTTCFIFLVDFSFMIEKLAGRQHYPQGKIINSFSSLFNSWELNNLPICQQNDQYFVKTVKRTTLKIAINHSTTRLHLTRRGSQTRDLSLHGDEKKKREGRKRFWSHGHKVTLKVCWQCIARRNRKVLHCERSCRCNECHFQSSEWISSIGPVDTQQKTSGWRKQKKKW